MSTTSLILIMVAIYLASFYSMYRYIKIIYSPIGKEYGDEPEAFDFFITITPFLNTIAAAILWVYFPPKNPNLIGKKKPKPFIRKFFNMP